MYLYVYTYTYTLEGRLKGKGVFHKTVFFSGTNVDLWTNCSNGAGLRVLF